MLFLNVTYTVRKPGGTHVSGFLRFVSIWTRSAEVQASPAPRGGANYAANVAEFAPFS